MSVGSSKFAFRPCLSISTQQTVGRKIALTAFEALQTQENTKKTQGKFLNFIEALQRKKKGYLEPNILNPYKLL